MRLYSSKTSPFVRKVMVLLYETGQLGDVELVPTAGNPVDPGTMPVTENPLGKIPALVTDDGETLFDSRVICRYLDHRAGGGFYPEPPNLWTTLTLEALADGMVEAAILMVYENVLRPPEQRFADWIEAQWAKIERSLDMLEARWLDDLLEGPLDMGRVAIGCALAYIDLRHGARDWRVGRPGLARWEAGIAERESLRRTVPIA